MKRYLTVAGALVAGLMATGLASAQTPLTTELYVNGLSQPLMAIGAPGDSERLFVVEKGGDIEIIKNGVQNAQPFLDITTLISNGSEQGLLGMAFHPNYQSNGWFFVNYTNTGGSTKIVRYTRQSADLALSTSAVDVMTIGQPQSNHNGGMINFSPKDGMLYIATGDGGGGNDSGSGHAAGGNAQSLNTRLGKMLRINVDSLPHTIPSGNPYENDGFPEHEIWHYGLRNPWRFTFDSVTGDMYIGDVGQDPFSAVGREEVNFAANGVSNLNYGWRCREGTVCTGLSGCTCPSGALTDPIADKNWNNGWRSIAGGYVYRGEAIPDLKGTYFYADHSTPQIWSLRTDGSSISEHTNRSTELDPPGALSISSIAGWGQDTDGELYICDRVGGEIFKLVADGPFEGIGCATAGTYGDPRLHGEGTLVAGSSGSLNVTNAKENAANGLFFVGVVEGAATFYLGTLKPVPWIGEPIFIQTNASGEWTIPWASWPAGLPSGFEIFFQYALEDAGAANGTGVALTNALKATAP